MAKKKNNAGTLEQQLWKAADKLRKNMDAAEYKHVLLGLIFLKFISDAFAELHEKLKAGQGEYEGADPEDKYEYQAEKIFFVPPVARWNTLQAHAKRTDFKIEKKKYKNVGVLLDDAMDTVEKENPSLKGVLPKVYAKENLDKQSLGELIDLVSGLEFKYKEELFNTDLSSKDILGHVYEYFLGEFALAEGRKGGQFYTPRSVVQLLVEMLEPYEGRVFDPCCGSGGMFVQSEKFVEAHRDHYQAYDGGLAIDPKDRISIYGQESNQTTWRLARMNLAIRGIDSSNVRWDNEGSFLQDAHQDLKADFIIANPPFNDSDWSGDLLKQDARWQYGTPPPGNANFAWMQHFLFHLAPSGTAGIVLAKGSLTSKTSGEGDIRQRLIEQDLIDCIVNLPAKLFLNTQIPACLWFLARNKQNGKFRDRRGEVLFIDARNLGHLINRRTRELSDDETAQIADTYHRWRNTEGEHKDVPGFCKATSLDKIKEKGYVLTPGRYVGLPEEEDDFDFTERFTQLKAELAQQMEEEAELNERIRENLAKISG